MGDSNTVLAANRASNLERNGTSLAGVAGWSGAAKIPSPSVEQCLIPESNTVLFGSNVFII